MDRVYPPLTGIPTVMALGIGEAAEKRCGYCGHFVGRHVRATVLKGTSFTCDVCSAGPCLVSAHEVVWRDDDPRAGYFAQLAGSA